LVGFGDRSKLIAICGKYAAEYGLQTGPQNLEKFDVDWKGVVPNYNHNNNNNNYNTPDVIA